MNSKVYEKVAACQQGKEGLNELITMFEPILLHHAKLLHFEDAFEELQLSLIEIILKIPVAQFPTHSPDWYLLSYIKKAIRHRYIALSKKNSQEKMKLPLVPNIHDQGYHELEYPFLKDLLNRLTTRQRQVIWLEFYAGYREFEIAPLLGISRQAVNRLKARSLKNLKLWLND